MAKAKVTLEQVLDLFPEDHYFGIKEKDKEEALYEGSISSYNSWRRLKPHLDRTVISLTGYDIVID